VIKIFVATCPNNKKAEVALEHSIKVHCSEPFEIIWMRNGDEPFVDFDETNWGTGFTPFRWLIPILTNWTGKAIYLDVDVLLLDDIAKLWNTDMGGKAILSLKNNYSVMLMDCEKLSALPADFDEWKQSSCRPQYDGLFNDCVEILDEFEMVGELDPYWNCLDGKNIDWQNAGLIHYTNKKTQPWHPYPERHEYQAHENKALEALWWVYYKEAKND
jgi:hypothetical protein